MEEFILGGIQGFPRNKFMMQLDYGLVGDMESTDDGHSCFNLLCVLASHHLRRTTNHLGKI